MSSKRITARNIGAAAETYVGNTGDLFYDPTSTVLRRSNGTTPGGVIMSSGGDNGQSSDPLTFDWLTSGTSTQVLHGNASGTLTWSSVNLATDVTGNLSINHLASGTGATSSTFFRGDGTWATPTGTGGTVNSVSMTVPPFMAVSGSPVTGSGILALSFTSQAANLVHASPNGSAGVPTFRALVAADVTGLVASATTDTTNAANITSGTLQVARLPASGATAGNYTNANVTVDAAGRITSASNGSGGGTSLIASTPTVTTIAPTDLVSVSTGGVNNNITAENLITSLGSAPGSVSISGSVTLDMVAHAYPKILIATGSTTLIAPFTLTDGFVGQVIAAPGPVTFDASITTDGSLTLSDAQSATLVGTTATSPPKLYAVAGAGAAPVASAPINSVLPGISGTTQTGQILSATAGTWSGFPTPTFTYQWKRSGTPVSGATSSTYTLVSADVGTSITVTVTATNTSGTASATSAETATITSANSAPVVSVAPTISGTAQVGQVLTGTTGTWSGYPTPTFTYQWKRTGTPISGATASSYTLVTADLSNTITVTVTATNTSGSASSTSTATASVTSGASATLTVTGANPSTIMEGAIVTLSGSYTGPTPVGFEFSTDGGTTWATATLVSAASNTWSASMPIQTVGTYTTQIRKADAPSVIGTRSMTVSAAAFGWLGGAVPGGWGPDTSVSAATDTPVITGSGNRGFKLGFAGSTSSHDREYYFDLTTTLSASSTNLIYAGWGSSNTVAPAFTTSTDNAFNTADEGDRIVETVYNSSFGYHWFNWGYISSAEFTALNSTPITKYLWAQVGPTGTPKVIGSCVINA